VHRLLAALLLPITLPGVACWRTQSNAAPEAKGPASAPAPHTPSGETVAEEVTDAGRDATGLVARRRTFAHEGPPDWDGGVPESDPNCLDDLARAGIAFRPARLPVHTEHGIRCGAPQVVMYVRGPGNIAYDPPPVLTCRMALALASFEAIVQEEADRTFRSPVARIEQVGTYNCRPMTRFKLVSEHAYANAIDLTRFTLKNGKNFTVLRDFDKGEGVPARPEGAFLRAVSQRADEEGIFSLVLTPFWDELHNNHFHLDLAPYRVDGSHRHEGP
jgi:hypothetical protein